MFWKTKKPELIFECDNWAVRKYSPIRPASEFIPEKFKNLPSVIEKGTYQKDNIYSIKLCPGLQDYIGQGYVIPAWCDIDIKIMQGTPKVIYSDPQLNEALHYPEQMGNFLDTKFPIRAPVKLDNPWISYSKKEWSILYLPMHFHENPYFEAIPGIIDHDRAPGRTPLNIMLKTEQDFLIKQGTPLVQMIPFKRQEVTARTGKVRDKTIQRLRDMISTTSISFKGWRWWMVDKKLFKINANDTDVQSDAD